MPVPPSLKKEQKSLETLLAICKDADKLDRVRLDSMGTYPREGLDASRLSLESSKKLESVAYQSFDKVLRILDIEKELQSINIELGSIDKLSELKSDYEYSKEAEDRLFQARENCKQNTQNFLRAMIKDKRLSKISQIPKKIKEFFLSRESKKGDLDK